MQKYLIKVNGISYEVEVEEMNSSEVSEKTSANKVESKNTKTEVESVKQTNNTNGQGTSVSAPMPGTIKKVCVNNGDSVKKGQVLFILEAMKLENEIMSPCDGKIQSVSASESASVNSGDVLCVIA